MRNINIITTGYAYKMRERALFSHAIPVAENFPLAKSPKEVVNNIISFLSKENFDQRHNLGTFELSPVFTLESKVQRVDHTIEEDIKDAQKV